MLVVGTMCRYILADVAGDNDLEKQLDEGQIYSMRTFLSAMYALLQLTVGNNWCVRRYTLRRAAVYYWQS